MRVLEASSLIVVVTLFASSCLCIVLPSQPRVQAIPPMSANAVPGNGGSLDWAKHEAEIHHLLLKQKMKLPAVRRYMKEKHDFDATYASFLLVSLDLS